MSLQFQPRSMAARPLIAIFLIFSIPSISAKDTKTAYEVLEEYDLPIGLLPKGVTGYVLNTTTGKFSVYLNETCTYKIDSYELKYKTTVTGVIAKDKLSSLSGIKVKVSFLWLSIVKVTRDDDELEFSVGIASADFPVSNFAECPTCGCGFDCETVKSDSLVKPNRLVSSS